MFFGCDELIDAAVKGDMKRVKKLLDKGCDPNIRDEDGSTPLHKAALFGHLGVVRELLAGGADPNIKDNKGRTPADIAREKGYENIAELIEKSKEALIRPITPPRKVRREKSLLIGRPLSLACKQVEPGKLDKVLRLGNYECRGYLNMGGFAAVLVCNDDKGRSYAMKIPIQVFNDLYFGGSSRTMYSSESLEKFKKEAEILRKIAEEHPCIVRLLDLIESPPALIFELCSFSLRDLINEKGGLGPTGASEVLVQISDALAFMHEKGYVHGDLKPENILFTWDRIPKLADFNTAKALASVSKSRLGWTPGYAAPEQMEGRITEKADSWALGLVLYEASTGRPLLSPTSYREDVEKLRRGEIKYKSAGSRELDEIILSCIKIEPDERMDVAEARDRLAEILLES